jgi:hypothetical protein
MSNKEDSNKSGSQFDSKTTSKATGKKIPEFGTGYGADSRKDRITDQLKGAEDMFRSSSKRKRDT